MPDKSGKQARQQAILALIEKNHIARQEEILLNLKNLGFDVTQATISRDIRELGLNKQAMENGGYCYVNGHLHSDETGAKQLGRFETIFRESVLSVDHAGHIVVVKCYNGMANAACEMSDSLHRSAVVGTLAGDDTFFVVCRTERDAKTICSDLTRYTVNK